MNEITLKIHNKVTDELKPVIQKMIDAGMDKNRIVGIINKHSDIKTKEYYKYLFEEEDLFKDLLNKYLKLFGKESQKGSDSRAESVFYKILEEVGIDFKFQYKIGKYRVDYLFGKDLVIELDGPHHNTQKQKKHDDIRDEYLKKMGYRVLRVPLHILALSPTTVVNSIIEEIL